MTADRQEIIAVLDRFEVRQLRNANRPEVLAFRETLADELMALPDVDDEEFCPKCFAGMTAANHDECVDVRMELGRRLGRKEAGEEIAARCERDVVYDTTARWHFAKIAREIAKGDPT